MSVAAAADRPGRTAAASGPKPPPVVLAGLSVMELRRAFVLSEILQPPLAIRTRNLADMSL